MPTDNILWSCVECDAKELTSQISCDYEEFASDHVPVKGTVTTLKGTITAVTWNIGQTDLTYFYSAGPEYLKTSTGGKVPGTIILFAPEEAPPESLDLPITEESDVYFRWPTSDVTASEEDRFVAPKGSR